MTAIPVFNINGEKVGETALPENIEKNEYSPSLLHEVVTAYLANQRKGTHCTKTRAEVSGSGAKPWRQKHTGRARSGSIRSPLWRKGGVVFGPKPRSYRQNLPKKKLRRALENAIKYKASTGNLMVLNEIKLEVPKTKKVIEILKKLNINGENTLMVVKTLDRNVKLASKNIENLHVLQCNSLNTYDVLRSKKVVFSQEAFDSIGL
ncbi:MAG: 50S ribosomal protein L4 [Elusimicrobiota bacterium]